MAIRQIDGPRAGSRPGSAETLVVLLHGYGADGNDLIGLAGPLGEMLEDAAFVSPHAPESCAVNPGGRQWFPIPWIDGSSEVEMGQSFAAAQDCLNGFLDRERERFNLPASRLALVGFSQGTMMALHVGLRRTEPFACIVGYSGRLLLPERLAKEIRCRPPVLLCHGDADEMVPVDSVHEAANALGEQDVPVRWHVSPGVGHGIDEAGLRLGSRFLREHLRGRGEGLIQMVPEAILDRLVSFETVSHRPNRDLIGFAASLLKEAGIEPLLIESADGAKANLYATTGPGDRGGVLLSGHTDVVPSEGQRWTVPPFRLTCRDGRYYGRGTADMKGFVACALDAMRKAAVRPLRTPLHLALTHDEEIGCIGVHSLIDRLEAGPVLPRMCLVGEPTLHTVAIGHKGKAAFRATCRGREGHSAMAPNALNAIHLGAGLVAALQQLQERIRLEGARDGDYAIPYTTVHAGRIGGGSVLNIVPNHCDLDFEFRTISGDDAEALLEAVLAEAERLVEPFAARFPEAAIEIEQLFAYPGLDTPPDAEVVAFAQSLAGSIGHCKVPFGTEGGLFAARLGIPTVVCGPGSMAQGHKPDEFVEAVQIEETVLMLDMLLDRLEAGL